MKKQSKYKLIANTIAVGVSIAITGSALAVESTLTRSTGAPVGNNQNSLTAGPLGPTLLQDHQLIEKLAHFDRERIPERVVHARGTGAFGIFKATADLTDITRAAPFQLTGKETPVFVRFSSVVHSKHSPETLRDPHGFAVKFYTEQGNWDLVGNNFPTFFIRDAIKFPDMVHAFKPNPKTNIQEASRVFDFFSHIPEGTRTLTLLYSPLGIPASYREMDGAGVHAFKFTNADCRQTYVKFTWKSRQGNKGLSPEQASAIQAKNFNHLTADLYSHIEQGKYPVWDLYIQTMKPKQLDDFDFNPLDDTKIWPEELVASRKVGELTLNKVPDNFFQSTEQSAFAPSNMIPGIEPSEDRMLQGRLFSYADTQRYRLGINHLSLPVNAPKVTVNSHNQDGAGYSTPETSTVNYQPSRSGEGFVDDKQYEYCQSPLEGSTQQIPFEKTQNFTQAGELYRSFSEADQTLLVNAFAGDLKTVANREIRTIITSFLYKADSEYGKRVADQVDVNFDDVKQRAESYKE
ncbi:catalase [Methylobacter sp. G7]|uniref:catalase n=1 Tax=Methylobacter sp. G7 TaxID=3230117 RepID=UPI003D801E17